MPIHSAAHDICSQHVCPYLLSSSLPRPNTLSYHINMSYQHATAIPRVIVIEMVYYFKPKKCILVKYFIFLFNTFIYM